jgi:hypothetical protein
MLPSQPGHKKRSAQSRRLTAGPVVPALACRYLNIDAQHQTHRHRACSAMGHYWVLSTGHEGLCTECTDAHSQPSSCPYSASEFENPSTAKIDDIVIRPDLPSCTVRKSRLGVLTVGVATRRIQPLPSGYAGHLRGPTTLGKGNTKNAPTRVHQRKPASQPSLPSQPCRPSLRALAGPDQHSVPGMLRAMLRG